MIIILGIIQEGCRYLGYKRILKQASIFEIISVKAH